MSTAGDQPEAGEDSLRLDKWLWYARFFKSRSLASTLCASGKVRIGGEAVRKANRQVRPGDVVTFPQGRHIRVIKILALATRRGLRIGDRFEAAGITVYVAGIIRSPEPQDQTYVPGVTPRVAIVSPVNVIVEESGAPLEYPMGTTRNSLAVDEIP